MTPLLPWFYDREQSAVYCASDNEPEIICQILDEKLAETIIYAVNCLPKSYTDKASAWDAIAQKNAEIERLRAALEFYADRVNYRSNWIFVENVLADRGDIARKALVSCTCGGDLNQPASHHDISCPSTLPPSERGSQ